MNKNGITIIGAGSSGLAMAAHLAISGVPVRLWNRSINTLGSLRSTRRLRCDGAVSGVATLAAATVDIDEALGDSKLLMITTPASAHAEIARLIAPKITSDMTVVLNPGRTLGALEFAFALRQLGVDSIPLIAETQTIIYTCRKTSDDCVAILTLKDDVLLSVLGGGQQNAQALIANLPSCIRDKFSAADDWVQTSIGNVGMILHCLPMLLNVGWIESPRAEFKYYYDGITPTVAGLAERLDAERVAVSRGLGHEVEGIVAWFRRSYGVQGDSLFECIQNNHYYRTIDAPAMLQHRYLLEDVPCGLVPVEALGRAMGLPMPITTLTIDLASRVLNVDFRREGRNLERFGFDPAQHDVREFLVNAHLLRRPSTERDVQ